MKIKNLKLKIIGMHCSACAMDIDGTLEDTDGIIESNTSYAKARTEVTFDEGKLSADRIRKIISELGYNFERK